MFVGRRGAGSVNIYFQICIIIPGNIDIIVDVKTGCLFKMNNEKALEKTILIGLQNHGK